MMHGQQNVKYVRSQHKTKAADTFCTTVGTTSKGAYVSDDTTKERHQFLVTLPSYISLRRYLIVSKTKTKQFN
jgi:hypothetical protein